MGLPEYAMKSTSRGITYTQRGVGPAMILVHGWCLNRTLWTYHEESLASSGYHVISPDLPGFGDSRVLAGPYDLDRYVDELATFIQELGLDRVVVVGFAFGAAVAMALAARDGSRIAATGDAARLAGFRMEVSARDLQAAAERSDARLA
jgi:pimeloyl-ACP methyl ester carboxylesterase